jgi:hypothetical protein
MTVRLEFMKKMIPNALLERRAWSHEFVAEGQRGSRHIETKGLRELLARNLRKRGRS